MTDQESVLRRMREANPVPSLDGLRADDLAAVRALVDRKRGRVAAAPVFDGEHRWRRAALAFAGALVVTLLVFGTWLLVLDDGGQAPVVVPVTTAPTTTEAAATTVSVPGKAPVASVGDLVAIHTAINEKDDAAHLGMITDDSRKFFFNVHGLDAGAWGNRMMRTLLPGSLDQVMETGEVVVSGYAGAAALRLVYPDGAADVGFDTWVAEPVAGGFLYAGGACISADEKSVGYAAADPAVVAELLAAQAAAWACGDIDGVLAGYWEQATYVDGFAYEVLEAAELADFYAGMRLEYTGEPVISGPFVAVATRVTDLASGVATDGVSVYWVREGEIALHTLLTTTGE